MTYNLDCIRDILLTIEASPEPMFLIPQKFCDLLPNYSFKEVVYHCEKLYEGGYINLYYSNASNIPSVYPAPVLSFIGDMTYQGHQFLETIKPRDTWEKIKAYCIKTGKYSLPFIEGIVSAIATGKIQELF